MTAAARVRGDPELLAANRSFYDPLWRDAQLVQPERFNTWPLVSGLASRVARRLEVAPGLRPRLPLADTQFADISVPALACLRGPFERSVADRPQRGMARARSAMAVQA